jgi:hypothetical protein
MTRLTLDARAVAELQTATGEVEICDETGRPLGIFRPFSPAHVSLRGRGESPFSEAELQERSGDLSGRSLQEIWQELGAR